MSDPTVPQDLVGVDEVCALLEVTPDRVQVMVDGKSIGVNYW